MTIGIVELSSTWRICNLKLSHLYIQYHVQYLLYPQKHLMFEKHVIFFVKELYYP